MTPADYECALARIPKWMLGLAAIGAAVAAQRAGVSGAAGFAVGAWAAWLNLRLVERAVNRIVRLAAASEPGAIRKGSGFRIFAQFAVFATLAFVILKFTGFNLKAALLGFLVCPAAAVLEIVYELFTAI